MHGRSAPTEQVHHTPKQNLPDDPSLTMEERGGRAGARLAARGQAHDLFACAGALPPGATQDSDGSKAFLAACLKG
jgi:hypothetical protein